MQSYQGFAGQLSPVIRLSNVMSPRYRSVGLNCKRGRAGHSKASRMENDASLGIRFVLEEFIIVDINRALRDYVGVRDLPYGGTCSLEIKVLTALYRWSF